jgi:LacI family transcriptional regulator
MTIGVLTQLIGSPFFDTIAQGVIAGLNGTGYSPIFVDGQWKKDEELSGIQALLGRRVDGLILIGGGLPGDEIARRCADLPTVIVARQLPSDQHNCIFMDNVAGGALATRHLIQNGHRRIAIIRGLEDHADSTDRFSGYEQAMQEAQLPVEQSLILDGDFSAESGERCTEELLTRQATFSAIFATNDMMAFGARLALSRRGIRVPEDVSLVGFDDQMESAFTTPPLTTIRQPAREMGEQASQAVLGMINDEPFSSNPVEGELIVRESVSRLNH